MSLRLLDVNVCLHALFPDSSPESEAVTAWLQDAVQSPEPLGLSEEVLASMIRIATNARIYQVPSSVADAVAFADALLAAPRAVMVRPARRHWALFTALLTDLGLRANDVPDAFLAALALEHEAQLVTRDRGFRRFPGLRVLDPLG